jgi:hypothetical protein
MCLGSGCGKPVLWVERPIRSIEVMSFFIGDPSGEGKRLIEGPISGRLFPAGGIAPNARRELTVLRYRKLGVFPHRQRVPLKEVEGG